MEKTAINCHPCVSMGASPYARGGFYGTVPDIAPVRLIPVRTGQILNSSKKSPRLTYCRFLLPWIYDKFSMYYFFEMYFADNTFWSISPQNPHIFVITVQRTHPRMYWVDPMILFLQSLHTRFIPVYTGLECINTYYKTIREWLIPVYTGQMIRLKCVSFFTRTHPRVYGADTKFLKRIPVISKPFFCLELPQQNQYVSFWPGIFCG